MIKACCCFLFTGECGIVVDVRHRIDWLLAAWMKVNLGCIFMCMDDFNGILRVHDRLDAVCGGTSIKSHRESTAT